MDFRVAFETLPAVDLVSLIRKLPVDSATSRAALGPWAYWDAHKENTARLLEIESYKLEMAWVDRVTDPEDVEVKRERAAAKRAGLKPPKRPIIPPVALRPRELTEEREERYAEEVAAYQVKSSPQPKSSSRASFETAWGIES